MLKSGDKLVFTLTLVNPVNFYFHKGDVLTLIEPTGLAPHGYQSKINNWLVDGPNGRTVWSSIYKCVEVGWLEKIK